MGEEGRFVPRTAVRALGRRVPGSRAIGQLQSIGALPPVATDDAQIKPGAGILGIEHAVVGADMRTPQSFVVQSREVRRQFKRVFEVDNEIVFLIPAGISLFP